MLHMTYWYAYMDALGGQVLTKSNDMLSKQFFFKDLPLTLQRETAEREMLEQGLGLPPESESWLRIEVFLARCC